MTQNWTAELAKNNLYIADELKKYGNYGFITEEQTGYLQGIVDDRVTKKISEIHSNYLEEINNLKCEIARSRRESRIEIEDLKSKVENLQQQINASGEIVEVKSIPIEQIKEEMIELLSDKKTRYADEIADELNLDIKDVIEAFDQLQKEGKLFIDGNKI